MPENEQESGPATVEPEGEGASDAISDEAFEQALAALECGREFDLAGFLAGRERSRLAVEEAVRLARDVVVHAPRSTDPPREVAGYEIERELGAGSMGAVFLARQRSLGGRRVALKVLPPSLGLSGGSKARFLNEARALAKLDHPGIVGVLDVIDADGIVAFAMDWMPGGSLAGVLAAWRAEPERDELDVLARCLGVERASLPASRTTTWLLGAFARLARALGAVHGAGLLHRDIKPANILVRGDGELLLSDFGLVRDTAASLHTRTGQYVGTLAYSAPEQLRGDQAAVDARSDVYSFGATLYEALTLKLPYSARTMADVQRRAESGLFDVPRRKGTRLPRDLETILGKTLDPEPGRRYASAEELAEDLDRLLAFRPIRARPAAVSTRGLRFLRRHRGAFLASCVVGFVVLASAVQGSRWWLDRQRAEDNATGAWRRGQLTLLQAQATAGVATSAKQLGDAIRVYDAALGFRPGPGLTQEIAAERAVLELALAAQRGSDEPSAAALAGCTLTLETFRRWKSGRRPSQAELDGAAPFDRRLCGLFENLMGEPWQAFEAWRPFAGGIPIDPLADALQGQYLRGQGKYEQAYALLRTALDRFSEANFLTKHTAEAAAGSGRLKIAEDLLAKAETLPDYPDPFATGRQTMATVFALRAQDADACALYRDAVERSQGATVNRYHFAQFLELRGQPLEALWLMDGRLPYEFVRLAEEWWNADERPTWVLLRNCLADPDLPVGPFPAFLMRYRTTREAIDAGRGGPRLDHSPFTSLLHEARDARPQRRRNPTLLELVSDGALNGMDLRGWRQWPAGLQDLHAFAVGQRWPLLAQIVEALASARLTTGVALAESRAIGILGLERGVGSATGADNCRRVDAAPATSASEIWAHPCRGTPAVAEGLAVFQESEEHPTDFVGRYGRTTLVALDLESGAERWRVATSSYAGLPLPIPCILGGRVFLAVSRQASDLRVAPARTQRVECRGSQDGKLLWTWDSATDGGVHALQPFVDAGGAPRILLTRSDLVRPFESLTSDVRLTCLDPGASDALGADLQEERGPWRTAPRARLVPAAICERDGRMLACWVEPTTAAADGAESEEDILIWRLVSCPKEASDKLKHVASALRSRGTRRQRHADRTTEGGTDLE